METTVDLHGSELARQFGITCPSLRTPDVSRTVTIAVRKDDTPHPQDATHDYDHVRIPRPGHDPPGGPLGTAYVGVRALSAA